VSYARPYLQSFRFRQRRLFDSTVTVVRQSGLQDGPSGTVDMQTVPVYQGAAQVLKPEAVQRPEVIGAKPVEVSSFQATIPHDVDVRKRDLLTVDGSYDPTLVGRTFRVVEVRRSEWLVNRKLTLEDTGK
jgi:hypothetical protein